MSSPWRVILPPLASLLLALILPAWVMVEATSSMTPPLLTIAEAEIRPVFLMTELIS